MTNAAENVSTQNSYDIIIKQECPKGTRSETCNDATCVGSPIDMTLQDIVFLSVII